MFEKCRFLKYFSIPALFFILALAPASYFAWKEYTLSNELTDQALNGNPIAVQILIQYEKPWKLDEKLVRAALSENEHAIKVLGLSIRSPNG